MSTQIMAQAVRRNNLSRLAGSVGLSRPRGTAKLFIAEGARVAVTGRDDSVFERAKAEHGEHARVLKGDVRSIPDMRAIAADAHEQSDAVTRRPEASPRP